jgi:hypothetical protein
MREAHVVRCLGVAWYRSMVRCWGAEAVWRELQ